MTVTRNSACAKNNDQADRFKTRNLRSKLRVDGAHVEESVRDATTGPWKIPGRSTLWDTALLSDICRDVVVKAFADCPVHIKIPARYVRGITDNLPVNIDFNVAAQYVFDEDYWNRRCIHYFPCYVCRISEHGLTWKQLFVEIHIEKVLENLEPDEEDTTRMLISSLNYCRDSIFSLRARKLFNHISLDDLCRLLPNLTRLDVTYGLRKIGMEYDHMMFGMKISDAHSLAKCVMKSTGLTTLILQSNLVDDDLLRVLATGLVKNQCITHLDLAHNRITNHGVRLVVKLLDKESVITRLNLADNLIHDEGGRYLGRVLKRNDSLMDMNLRLNRLSDEGGHLFLQGLRMNSSLTALNLSANSIGTASASLLAHLIECGTLRFMVVDVSSNNLNEIDTQLISEAIKRNTAACSLDVRFNERIYVSDDA